MRLHYLIFLKLIGPQCSLHTENKFIVINNWHSCTFSRQAINTHTLHEFTAGKKKKSFLLQSGVSAFSICSTDAVKPSFIIQQNSSDWISANDTSHQRFTLFFAPIFSLPRVFQCLCFFVLYIFLLSVSLAFCTSHSKSLLLILFPSFALFPST